MNFGSCLTSNRPFHFGSDQDRDPNPGIFNWIFTTAGYWWCSISCLGGGLQSPRASDFNNSILYFIFQLKIHPKISRIIATLGFLTVQNKANLFSFLTPSMPSTSRSWSLNLTSYPNPNFWQCTYCVWLSQSGKYGKVANICERYYVAYPGLSFVAGRCALVDDDDASELMPRKDAGRSAPRLRRF